MTGAIARYPTPAVNVAPLELSVLFRRRAGVVRSARSATTGWRMICVRARRSLGSSVVGPLADLDLDYRRGRSSRGSRASCAVRPPRSTRSFFELFEPVTVLGEAFAGFRLTGTRDFDPKARWLARAPEWQPSGAHLASAALDGIVTHAPRVRLAQRPPVLHALRFGAAALLARGVAEASLAPQRVVVAFEQGEAYEVRSALAPRLVLQD